jgi:hypothetical protein
MVWDIHNSKVGQSRNETDPILFASVILLPAGNLNVLVIGLTPQQAVLRMDAPENGTPWCKLANRQFQEAAYDVDPALFPDADHCGRASQLTPGNQHLHFWFSWAGLASDGI